MSCRLAAWSLLTVPWISCAPSPEDLIDDLASADRESARQELLLAAQRSVGPVLAALDQPRRHAIRSQLVSLLTDLVSRTDDPRARARLDQLLRTDPDPWVRAHVARWLGVSRRTASVGALVAALADEDNGVRYEALCALGLLGDHALEGLRDTLRATVSNMVHADQPAVRDEALIWVERFADQELAAARRAELEGRIADAESLLLGARQYAPGSKRVQHRLGRFYLETGHRAEGYEVLRRRGLLLDVPLLAVAPVIDGRLDDSFWESAARSDSFHVYSDAHLAWLPPTEPTSVFVARTAKALYVGIVAFDAHPDSLVSGGHGDDTFCGIESWHSDFVNFLFYPDPEARSWGHIGFTAAGRWGDSWHGAELRPVEDHAWNAHGAFAVHVGADRWSVEYRLDLGQPRVPHPQPGDTWGFNVDRLYRGREVSRWIRLDGRLHATYDFGLLLFL